MTAVAIIALVMIIIFIGILYLRRNPVNEIQSSPRGESYIGKVFTLEFPIINGTGILQVDNTTWRIHCVDLPAGARIKIIGIDGLVLLAEPNHS